MPQRRSESRRLDWQQGVTTEPRFVELLRLEDTKQLPRVLRVQTRIVGGSKSDIQREELLGQIGSAGVWWNSELGDNGLQSVPWDGGAAMQIETGTVGAGTRMIYADIRPGEYVLPPCTHARVSAAWWRLGVSTLFQDAPLEVTVEIADGVLADYTPFMVSAQRSVWTGDTVLPGHVASVSVPPGAYAWDVGMDGQTPRIEARCGTVHAIRDRVLGVHWPGVFPLPMHGSGSNRVWVTNADLVANPPELGEERTWTASVLFFVR